jgi:ferredoxin
MVGFITSRAAPTISTLTAPSTTTSPSATTTTAPILCDGFEHCHELTSELVRMDEWGSPMISNSPVPHDNLEAPESAKHAVRGCPRQALKIERISDPQ